MHIIPKMDIQLIHKNNEPLISHVEIALRTFNDEDSVKKLIEKYKTELDTFGVTGFQILKPESKGGRPKTIYYLNEPQLSFLIMCMRNNEFVIKFKLQTIKSFFEAKAWIKDRLISKGEFPEMSQAVLDHRKMLGKETKDIHYICESKLVATVVTGYIPSKYCEVMGVERESFRNALSNPDQKLLHKVQQYNTVMIEAGVEYPERKEQLMKLVARQRKALNLI